MLFYRYRLIHPNQYTFNEDTNKTSVKIVEQDSIKILEPFEIHYLTCDTLKYSGYNVIRNHSYYHYNDIDSEKTGGLSVFRGDSEVFHFMREGDDNVPGCRFALVQIIPHYKNFLLLESDGDNRYSRILLIDLTDSLHIVYDTDKSHEHRYSINFIALDIDSILEFRQNINPLSAFERLCNADEPYAEAYFRSDCHKKKYVIANRDFTEHILRRNRNIQIRNKCKSQIPLIFQLIMIIRDFI